MSDTGKSGRRGLVGLLLTMVAGCATTQVSTDLDPRVNFTAYETFDVAPGRVINEGREDPGDTLVRDRIDAALTTELAEKGMQSDEQQPDLIVRYTAEMYTQPEVHVDAPWSASVYYGSPFYDPFWGGYWGPYAYPYGAGYSTYDVTRGRMVIEVIDADSQKLVYRAEARAEDKNFRSFDYIRKAVDKAMKSFPAT
jgi:hypothetical protein